jgi:hypothetical protein
VKHPVCLGAIQIIRHCILQVLDCQFFMIAINSEMINQLLLEPILAIEQEFLY